ncbi:hypothetical protein A9R01_07635 ['Osedax' symbiont bacterium Rs2_46_30_T18]|nr:hypothetical protein A9R01_07635 ['Osedax' symbiont bacterium Rs2_46_30_T18]
MLLEKVLLIATENPFAVIKNDPFNCFFSFNHHILAMYFFDFAQPDSFMLYSFCLVNQKSIKSMKKY